MNRNELFELWNKEPGFRMYSAIFQNELHPSVLEDASKEFDENFIQLIQNEKRIHEERMLRLEFLRSESKRCIERMINDSSKRN